MGIFGSDYDYGDDLFIISGDLDMDGNRITYLKNRVDSNDAVNKMGPVKRICVFEHSVMTNFNCACPAIQRG